jgi:hypothetical protein
MFDIDKKKPEPPATIKTSAHDIILHKLLKVKARIDKGKEPTLPECKFILDCYKMAQDEQMAEVILNLGDISTEDLKSAYLAGRLLK